MMNAEDKISACILRLRRKTPFFGALALFMEHVLDEQVPTACTDGREVRFNPQFVDSLASAELDAVMVHELLHAALLHIPRRRERDPLLWNVAADIVVNGIIRKQQGLHLPLNPCIDARLEKYEVEEVYEILLDRGGERGITWIGADLLPGGGGGGLSEGEKRELEAHWKQAWHQAATIAQAFGQGSIPNNILRHMENILDPMLDWRSLLWRFMVRTPVDFTEFDRRLIGRGIYLESLAGETVSVRIAVDTSGSIDSKELSQFLAEVREILHLYPHINAQLFYADAALYGPFDLEEASLAKPVGGGGTSFVPFFERMHEEVDFGENTVLIYLTDGHGTFPKQPPTQPVLWVVKPGGLDSGRFPFGTVVRYLPDQQITAA
jgi:predicted metal-dependent peptidase